MQEREQVHMIPQDLKQALRLVEGAVTIIRECEEQRAYATPQAIPDLDRREMAALHRLNEYLSGSMENVTIGVADWCGGHPQPVNSATHPFADWAAKVDEIRRMPPLPREPRLVAAIDLFRTLKFERRRVPSDSPDLPVLQGLIDQLLQVIIPE